MSKVRINDLARELEVEEQGIWTDDRCWSDEEEDALPFYGGDEARVSRDISTVCGQSRQCAEGLPANPSEDQRLTVARLKAGEVLKGSTPLYDSDGFQVGKRAEPLRRPAADALQKQRGRASILISRTRVRGRPMKPNGCRPAEGDSI